MTPAEDAANRAAAASSPGYACYPGETPPGNPRRIVLPVSWARQITDPRPLAEITPTQPIPATLGSSVRPRSPMTRMVDDLRQDLAPVIAAREDPPAPKPEPAGEPAEVALARYWAGQRHQADAPAPKPGEPRRWWHVLTARRR